MSLGIKGFKIISNPIMKSETETDSSFDFLNILKNNDFTLEPIILESVFAKTARFLLHESL